MALRLLELTVPEDQREGVEECLEDQPLIQTWYFESSDSDLLVRMLVDSSNSEELSDRLVDRFQSEERFRLNLWSVEATQPAVDDEDGENDSENTDNEKVGPERISREELHHDLTDASRLTWVYATMVALSTVVAAIGLIRGDLAIVIGAMLIAPLLGPNIALSLAATLADLAMAIRSLKAMAVGVFIVALLSVLMGILLGVDPTVPEIASRTEPSAADIILALAAGAAGALAFTSVVPTVVVGVMVAVALLPPLVVAGLLLGSGHWGPAWGAVLLGLTNVICINLAAVVCFLAQKVRPRTWWEADRARKATRYAIGAWVGMVLLLLGLILLTRMDWPF